MNKKFYNSYIDLFETLSDKTQSIFRGQSNTGNFWEIKSSYNRKYWSPFHKHALHIKKHLEKYNFIKEYESLMSLNKIELLIYLQHYGFPTPLIDFTKSPFIAFYFACSDVFYSTRSTLEFFSRPQNSDESEYRRAIKIATKCSNGNPLTSDEFKILFEFQKDFFISLIQFEIENPASNGFLIDIKSNDNCYDYDYVQSCRKNDITEDEGIEGYLFSILDPPKSKVNYNLNRQKSVFIYFDSAYSLESFISNFGFKNSITYHLIPKPCLNLPDSGINKKETVFQYLKSKGISGAQLFNDLQGFQYDFLNYMSGE